LARFEFKLVLLFNQY